MQEEGDEEEDEDVGYLDNLYGDKIICIPGKDIRESPVGILKPVVFQPLMKESNQESVGK